MDHFNPQPLLSVRFMCYEQAHLVDKALHGIAIQEIDFPVEIVVGDDFSKDGTLENIKAFAADQPELHFRILDRQRGDAYDIERQRRGRLFNFANIITQCKGKYIALIDGDDYWTDPLKLKKQVRFLEAHPDYSMCHHQVKIIDDTLRTTRMFNVWEEDRDVTIEDLTRSNRIATSSVVYRNFGELPEWFTDLHAGDWGLHLMNYEKGKIRYLSDEMGVYLRHENAIWSQLPSADLFERGVELMQELDKAFGYRYTEGFKKGIAERRAKMPAAPKKLSVAQRIKHKVKRTLKGQ